MSARDLFSLASVRSMAASVATVAAAFGPARPARPVTEEFYELITGYRDGRFTVRFFPDPDPANDSVLRAACFAGHLQAADLVRLGAITEHVELDGSIMVSAAARPRAGAWVSQGTAPPPPILVTHRP